MQRSLVKPCRGRPTTRRRPRTTSLQLLSLPNCQRTVGRQLIAGQSSHSQLDAAPSEKIHHILPDCLFSPRWPRSATAASSPATSRPWGKCVIAGDKRTTRQFVNFFSPGSAALGIAPGLISAIHCHYCAYDKTNDCRVDGLCPSFPFSTAPGTPCARVGQVPGSAVRGRGEPLPPWPALAHRRV